MPERFTTCRRNKPKAKPSTTRSDIFSLGVVYYEMLTGVRPFDADTPAALISQLLRDTPELIPNVPPELARIVRRCLAKPLDQRLQSALDLRNELQGRLRSKKARRRLHEAAREATSAPGWRLGLAIGVR